MIRKMARILFVVSSDPGHINPCIGPAWYLQDEGHQVAFFGGKDISGQLSAAGLDHAYHADAVAPARLDAVRSARLAENLKDRDWSRLWLRSMLMEGLQHKVERLLSVCREFQPDAMVVVAIAYEGAIVAQKLGIPWVSVTASMNPFVPDLLASDLNDNCKVFNREREELFAKNGVESAFRLTEVISPYFNMALTTNELIGHRLNPEYKRVGPSISPRDRGDETDFPWERVRDNVPMIYMSLGADTYNQPESLKRVFEAVKDRAAQLVVYSGTLAEDFSQYRYSIGELPANVLLCSYVPQLTVLAGSSAFITHGGATSVMEAIYFGVPMLVSPLWNDHAHQAFFVDKEGVGVRCEITKTSPAVLWKHLETLMTLKKYKDNTEKLQLSYKRNEGASEMARLIDQLVDKAKV